MKSFLELVRSRKSVRSYVAGEAPDDAELREVLEAARLAPSGNNSQPWRFIVVRDEAIKERLAAAAGEQSWIRQAPVVIAVVADPAAKMKKGSAGRFEELPENQRDTLLIKSVRDASIAADHMVLAASDMELGTCWIAMYEQEDIRPVLDVPDRCFVVTLIALGRAAEKPAESDRFRLEEITFYERYGRREP